MNRWAGFSIGVVIALITVMTLVRPADQRSSASIRIPVETHGAEPEHGPTRPQPEGPSAQTATSERPASDTAAETSSEPSIPMADAGAELGTPRLDRKIVNESPPKADVAEELPESQPEPPVREPSPATALTAQVASLAPEPSAAEPVSPSEPLAEATLGAPSPAPAAATPMPTAESPPTEGTRQWYAFWQPFTSELSANGFRARLEQVTGLDYRVVRVETGDYHVAFGYDDEESRRRNLAAIESATGLNLGGESL